MRNETWKTDRDLLSEAYDNVSETTHSPENSCKDDEYYCDKDKVCKKKETANEEMDLPIGDADPLGEPAIEPIHEPDEVDAEIDSLKNLILNPSKDKVEEYARQGQLHVYVDMLKKKLEAAEAVKAAVRGETE